MIKKTIKQSMATFVEAVAMSTAEKSKRQSCCIFLYQPKEPAALKLQPDTQKTKK
jgi:cyclic lactone autoinducer peptide